MFALIFLMLLFVIRVDDDEDNSDGSVCTRTRKKGEWSVQQMRSNLDAAEGDRWRRWDTTWSSMGHNLIVILRHTSWKEQWSDCLFVSRRISWPCPTDNSFCVSFSSSTPVWLSVVMHLSLMPLALHWDISQVAVQVVMRSSAHNCTSWRALHQRTSVACHICFY